MNIIVTGGLGFIGSNLVDALSWKDDANVIVIDNLISESASIHHKREEVQYIIDDATHLQEWSHELPDEIDLIFHLGAHARIQPSFQNPLATVRNNVQTTAAVCEFARHKNAKIVYAGSSSFYAGPMKNPYSFTKWQGEQICEMYQEVYDLNVSIARFFNVYGPRQPIVGEYGTVIGIFERQYGDNEDLTVVGDGEQRRDFTHVYDICSGLIAISEPDIQGIYNLGTGNNYSINEVADIIISRSAQAKSRRHLPALQKKYLPQRSGEARHTLADISKTQEATDWVPKYDLKDYLISVLT